MPDNEAVAPPPEAPPPEPAPTLARRGVAFLGRNRGVTALLAVMLAGVLFTPQPRATAPFAVAMVQKITGTGDAGGEGPPLFLTGNLHSMVLYEYAEYGILATGMTLVILTGGIDLSVGSVLGIAAVLFAWLHIARGYPALVAVAGAVGIGMVCGLANGWLVSRLGLQPFVATLAMMVAARGGAKVISGGVKVSPGAFEWYHVQGGNPVFMEWMIHPTFGGFLRPVTVLFVVTIVLMALVVKYARFGRHLYAIGGNEEAARLSGVPVHVSKAIAYILCGGLAGLAGICNSSRMMLGDPEAGSTYELDAIAAVVIGGTSLMGGRGSMAYTLLGTLIIGYINKILSINAVPEAYRLLAKGLIIVIAVVIQGRQKAK